MWISSSLDLLHVLEHAEIVVGWLQRKLRGNSEQGGHTTMPLNLSTLRQDGNLQLARQRICWMLVVGCSQSHSKRELRGRGWLCTRVCLVVAILQVKKAMSIGGSGSKLCGDTALVMRSKHGLC